LFCLYLIMNRIKLNDQLTFSIEKEEKRLRLIVSESGDELVCHKTDRNELTKFIQSADSHLFKGRLQLDKKGENVFIYLKGDIAGVIDLSEFERLMNHSYQPKQIA